MKFCPSEGDAICGAVKFCAIHSCSGLCSSLGQGPSQSSNLIIAMSFEETGKTLLEPEMQFPRTRMTLTSCNVKSLMRYVLT